MKVELRHIHKHFGNVHANDDVSLTIEAGTIHGLLGENGAGKSTLVKILSGFITRDSGEIALDGRPAHIQSPADALRYGIGMLHQDPLDFPPLTAIENFMAGSLATPALLNARAAERGFRALCSQFNFDLDPHARVSDLTVGERQQLEIVRLLANGAGTLILDEPTTGISASQKTLLFDALRRLAREGKSIIFVSHKLEDVEELCDCVTVMRRGRVVGELDLRPYRSNGHAGHWPADKRFEVTTRIVEMMFGKELAMPTKPATHQDEVILSLDGFVLRSDRLEMRIEHLAVQRGEVIGIAGLEGSGQQLFLMTCAGLEHPAAGSIHVGGRDLTHKPYNDFLRAGVCYLPADRLRDGLISGLTIQEHVALRMSGKGIFIDRAAAAQEAERAIATFNIRGRPDTAVERLSGGNQQRTQLALMPAPLNVLLMEHPTRGLDIESTLWVWQQLIARCNQGTAILFASSDLDEIVQYSDRVIVFSGGRISPPIAATELTADSLGQMIGGRF
ncbi:MAG: ATP-binding cassette domain-containing protein [Anaerolineae bacterium]|nr:ATP-binding cassette domain-containing protein [Candidatus Roseilinea sp.]MDW8450499.1 ATP-binding cassette domain-containing protein [Anaerolineae bacterium]